MKYPPLFFAPAILMTFCLLIACNQKTKQDKVAKQKDPLPVVVKDTVASLPIIRYQIMKKKDWQAQKDSFPGQNHLALLAAINRTDSVHLYHLDSILVPERFDLPLDDYLPFPKEVPLLADVDKLIIFSNPLQAFAAYKNGHLVIQGQSNTGKKSSQTPPKLYFANWKAKRSISTVDGSWVLKWNFNISNFGGIGFHEYGLPGYPASHSCCRLTGEDAEFLYTWTDQWILDGNKLAVNGTPVIVYGRYPFGSEKPWNALASNPQAMRLNQDSMKAIIDPYLHEILQKQAERKTYLMLRDSTVSGI